ncbi:MAG: hypothetical protein HZC36_03845 [Armatimonadetes bacterium]|nr:hypothetical protein [Armatimonadota bacterium]
MKLFALCLTTALVGWSCFLLESPGQVQKDPSPASSAQLAELNAPLFPKLFPNPTGQNGMEEYVLATDMVARSRFGDFQNWLGYKMSPSGAEFASKEELDGLSKLPFGDLRKTSVLEASRVALAGLDQVKELVRRGNGKPVRALPPDSELRNTFLARMKLLAKFFACEANAYFAQGKSNAGTDSLIVCLSMAHHVPQDGYVARLVSLAMSGIVLAEFEKHLDQLSSPDCRSLTKALAQLPQWDARIFEAVEAEAHRFESSLRQMAARPSEAAQSEIYDEDWRKAILAVSQAEWPVIVERAKAKYAESLRTGVSVLKGSEELWISGLEAQGMSASGYSPKPPRSSAELADQLAGGAIAILPQLANAEAKTRTQLRLLRLHARILSFKWDEGRMPKDLSKLDAPAAEWRDTFANGTFQYLPDRFGHYELFSKGFPPHGRIDLRWRRDPNVKPDRGDEPIPPRPR